MARVLAITASRNHRFLNVIVIVEIWKVRLESESLVPEIRRRLIDRISNGNNLIKRGEIY